MTPLCRFILRRIIFCIALAIAVEQAAAADTPFTFATTPGRLPKTVVPINYRLTIAPNPAALTLRGVETVSLDVREPTSTLTFNALNLRFSQASVDGRRARSIVTNDTTQRTTLGTATVLTRGRHLLRLVYSGKLETAAQGMFRQNYTTPGGKTGTLISTQFESTDARRMFAAWDEPAFRATYELTVVLPATWRAISNMPIASRIVHGSTAALTFARTPRMSSYLLEVTAGDIADLPSVDANGTRHEIWAVRGQERKGAYALANSKSILTAYDAYFGRQFPLPRLASIALPGGFDGAMENWGAITYNDRFLLLGPQARLEQRQDVYAVQAHEMAHQWFGDLVTMAWWDNLWLNESFASWMAAKQTDLAHPEWLWWQNQDADKELAMNADARVHTHPIQQPVLSDTDAEAAFDSEITYAKGQAFLRMLEAYLGPSDFRRGIRTYIAQRKFSNATGADLWAALARASGKPVARLATAWILQSGFPLVSVAATCDARGARTIALHQARFFLDGDVAARPLWTIPIGIASGSGERHYTLLTTRDARGIHAGRCAEPLLANAGNVGFYRVAYDAATLQTGRAAFATLPSDDKIAILDDQWALVRAGKAKLDSYLMFAAAVGPRINPRAWEQIAGALESIDQAEQGTSGERAFEAYARGVLRPLAAKLGYDMRPGDSPTMQQLRHTVVADLGAWREPAAIRWANGKFARLQANRDAVSADDQAVALQIVGEHATLATFEQLHQLAKAARDDTEIRRYYDALAIVRDPDLAQRALDLALSPEIPAQAESERLAIVYRVARKNPARSYRFLKAHATRLFAQNSVQDSVFVAQQVPEIYWDAAPLDQVVAWVKAHTPPEAAPELARGTERARFRAVSKTRLDRQADVISTRAAAR